MRVFVLMVILGLAALGADASQAVNLGPSKEPAAIKIWGPKQAQAGSSFDLKVELMNTCGRDLNAGRGFEAGLDLSYDYDVRRIEDGKSVAVPAHFPPVTVSSDIVGTLKPGQTMEGGTSISGTFFDLRPGKYTIQLSRDVYDLSGHVMGRVRSNTITITIVPAPFSIHISTPNTKVHIGSSVPLDIRMTNLSASALAFEAPPESGGVDTHFWYSCLKEGAGNVSRSGTLIPSAQTFALKSGETHEQRVDLASACDLSKPGTYRVRVLRSDPGGAKKGSVRSNEITVKVKP